MVYYKAKENITFSTWQKWCLATFRFLAMFLIGALLLAPFLKYQTTRIEKPILVIGQDVSQSVTLAMGEKQQLAYHQQWPQIIEDLEEKFHVVPLSFGDGVRDGLTTDYQDQVSNIATLLETVESNYGDQNLGAIVLATDGIYNMGKNPLYLAKPLKVPVFAVALGDTTIKKDAFLQRVFHNDLAYLNDQFTIQVDVNALDCTGNTVLTIYKIENNQNIKQTSQNIIYNQREFFTSLQFTIRADKPGVQRYRVVLSPITGEANTNNNYKDFFIDVLDNREKILIYAAAPHPDISALKQSLDKLSKYELSVKYWGESVFNPSEYDLVVWHQLPAVGKNTKDTYAELAQKKTPMWFILGAESDLNQLSTLQSGVAISSKVAKTNDVEASVETAFNLFTLSDDLKNNIKIFPPLSSPFGEYQSLTGNQILMNQTISKIETNYPLFSFHESNSQKTAVLAGEGLFKWRLYNYLNHQNHQIFDELVHKTLQFLTLKNDKRRFRVILSDRIFKENEQVQLDAELYNESYEPINDPEAYLSIFNDKREEFKYTFNRRDKYYHINTGLLSPGQYSFKATTTYGAETFNYEGVFSVEPLQLEAQNTTAKHNLLFQLALTNNGKVFYPHEMAQISKTILERDDLKPVQFAQVTTDPLINLKWLLIPIFLLLIAEWFLRRFFGTY